MLQKKNSTIKYVPMYGFSNKMKLMPTFPVIPVVKSGIVRRD